ncbi:MAG: 4-alpha-glucanotransferase, partial [Bacteroidales bacterium]|nr:4-alpha-glucanotransferase [Candidatus Sodaliphilus fimicaballi]
PTLRQWWDEDHELTQSYYNTVLWRNDGAPHPLNGELATQVVNNHLSSPSMLCLLSLQDWMATDEQVRREDANAERINIPANPRHYWRYRMHMTIEQLMKEEAFNAKVKDMITRSDR